MSPSPELRKDAAIQLRGLIKQMITDPDSHDSHMASIRAVNAIAAYLTASLLETIKRSDAARRKNR